MTTSITTTTPEQEAKQATELINTMLLKLAQLTTLRDKLYASAQADIEAIRKAASSTLSPMEAEMKELDAQIKDLAKDHKGTLFAKARTLKHQGHAVSLRSSTAYEVDDEEEVIGLLENMRDTGEDDTVRMAAAACLRVKTELDKGFVKSNWKAFGPWFVTYFGFRKVEKESVGIKLDLTPTASA